MHLIIRGLFLNFVICFYAGAMQEAGDKDNTNREWALVIPDLHFKYPTSVDLAKLKILLKNNNNPDRSMSNIPNDYPLIRVISSFGFIKNGFAQLKNQDICDDHQEVKKLESCRLEYLEALGILLLHGADPYYNIYPYCSPIEYATNLKLSLDNVFIDAPRKFLNKTLFPLFLTFKRIGAPISLDTFHEIARKLSALHYSDSEAYEKAVKEYKSQLTTNVTHQ